MKKILPAILILFFVLSVSACQAGGSKISKTDFIFDTVVTLTFYEGGDEALMEEAFNLCRDYQNLFSKTVEGSDIYKINHAKGEAVAVDGDTAQLVQTALQYSELSDGTFDITIGAATNLWDFKAENPFPPSKEQTDSILPLIDYHKIEIITDGGQDYIRVPSDFTLDLGGIAKGYVSDRLYEFLSQKDVTSGIINLGGNIALIGGKNEAGDFAVGVRDPQGSQSDIAGEISLRDTSVVSSGAYERGFDFEGVHYHHILDPKTGRSAQSDLSGVTIITKKGVDADALSTICYILGKEKAKTLIDSLDGVECVLLSKDGEITVTDGLAGRFEKNE